MRKFALVFALGAASLFGATAVSAADTKANTTPVANVANETAQAVDMSSHRRHWRRWHHRRHVWGGPYYRSYGYYPYYNSYSYYRPAPVLSFSIGGGPRFHHHRHWW